MFAPDPAGTSATSSLLGPLALFSSSHADTLHQCEALQRFVLYLGQCEPDAQTSRVSQELLDYFDVLLRQNHMQEETWLYPALMESMAGSDAVCLRDMASALTRQHRLLESMWRGLREQVAAIAAGRDAPSVISDVDHFVRLNRRHIQSEEEELLPMASRLIPDHALESMRDSMQLH
jgi:hemerythrin-like domain-containing protein